MVIGRGGDSTTLFSAMASLPIMPIIGKGDQQLQPIHMLTTNTCYQCRYFAGPLSFLATIIKNQFAANCCDF